jgi:DNA-binding response OmpR family regulator
MKHIRLLEDEHDIRIMLRHALEAKGFYVTFTLRLADALTLLERVTIDLLIADVVLRDGLGTIAADLARQRGIPYLLMTGSADHMAQLEANGRYFLAKPFRLATFIEQVISKTGPPSKLRAVAPLHVVD